MTPTITGRERFLAECRASVLTQTCSDWEQIVLLDEGRLGCAATMNEIAEGARGEWLLPLADDDLLLPGCLDTLLRFADTGDVIYAPPLVWGLRPEESAHFFAEPPAIPSFGLIRRELWEECGGYDDLWNREEDRRFWSRAIDQGARFVRCNDGPTWVYRHHAGNKSYHDGVAS